MSHSHALDLRITEAALRRGDLGWIGLIGSQTKRARFLQSLAQRGVGDAACAALQCPVGLPGLRGKEPEVIAVSILAQLLLHSSTG
jgi:xanthine dehydrogenase accessory factor